MRCWGRLINENNASLLTNKRTNTLNAIKELDWDSESIVGRLYKKSHHSLPLLGQSRGGRKAKATVATEAAKEMQWMKRFLQELGVRQAEYVVFSRSQSAMDLSKNATYHSCMKHIDARYRELSYYVVNKQSNLS